MLPSSYLLRIKKKLPKIILSVETVDCCANKICVVKGENGNIIFNTQEIIINNGAGKN